MAAGAMAAAYYATHDDPAKKEEEKTEETTKTENEKEEKQEFTEEKLIDLINEVSDTMLIVFQHLGRIAVDMARDGKSEEEIWKTISERFKSAMAVVEKHTCESHQIPLELYHQSFKKCSANPSKAFHNACYPCRYLLSRIENTEIEKAEIPEDLTVERVILLNQAIIELSCKCIDRIKAMLCDEMKVDEEELKKRIASNDGLKEQVFDLIVDAEKGSKKRVLEEEKVMEADLIICSLLYKENDIYEKKMEEMAKMRVEKLKELGLSN
ncbi:hypothetical protein WA588_006157 [Blastocystis sp. NMH]